ncbi:hypothetical protein F5Y19DRAFT_479745 [Xylariaceae sp. FL1651]|nr:hypothetical protein F5Y19DRAFT_479745 [Xylariaceae sp. FL1651]
MSKLTEKEIKRYGDILAKYFENDALQRYIFEGAIGKGYDGVIWSIMERQPSSALLPAANRKRRRSQSPTENRFFPKEGRAANDPLPLSYWARRYYRGDQHEEDNYPDRERESQDESSRRRTARRIVMKTDFLPILRRFRGVLADEVISSETGPETKNCENEANFLRRFRSALHIVKLLEISDDPMTRRQRFPPELSSQSGPAIPWSSPKLPSFARPSPLRRLLSLSSEAGIRSHNLTPENWLFEEYLENGSLHMMIQRTMESNAQIPNVLFWAIFLCLVKMVVALAWPEQPAGSGRNQSERCLPDKEMANITHGDCHTGNIMFGSFLLDRHHSSIPILKLIDFSAAEEDEYEPKQRITDPGPQPKAVADNIFAIGKTMVTLILPDMEADFWSGRSEQRPVQTSPGVFVQSVAVELLPDPNGNEPCPLTEDKPPT